MNIRKALLEGGVLTVAVAVAAGALWIGEAPAQTATTATAAPKVQLPWNSASVPVSGIVTGSPESVSFKGSAKVNTRLAPDPDFGSPSLVMSIDLSGVSGVGSQTQAKYVISGPAIVQKRLSAAYTIDLTFPFASGSGEAHTGVATFALSVNTATGALTSATGSVGSPNF